MQKADAWFAAALLKPLGIRLVVVACLIAAACSDDAGIPPSAADEIELRISFYSSKLANAPRLYPVHVQLAVAYFDKARESSDPRWLAEARRSLERSIAIVGTYEAFVTMARVANYSHRFEDAIRWAERALPGDARSHETDPMLGAIIVEALTALDRRAEARAWGPRDGAVPQDFFAAAAMAGWLASQDRHEEAARAYDVAAEFARLEKVAARRTWAEAMAAGALLDAGRTALARPRLLALRQWEPHDLLVRLHDAECLEAERRPEAALDLYEALLDERAADPEIHARAHKLANALGESAKARRHFEAAERGFRLAIDAGEVYTLGGLAQLYVEAKVRLGDAVTLAEENLRYRRDRQARDLLALTVVLNAQ